MHGLPSESRNGATCPYPSHVPASSHNDFSNGVWVASKSQHDDLLRLSVCNGETFSSFVRRGFQRLPDSRVQILNDRFVDGLLL